MNEGNFNSNINKPEEQKDENENFQILEKNQEKDSNDTLYFSGILACLCNMCSLIIE